MDVLFCSNFLTVEQSSSFRLWCAATIPWIWKTMECVSQHFYVHFQTTGHTTTWQFTWGFQGPSTGLERRWQSLYSSVFWICRQITGSRNNLSEETHQYQELSEQVTGAELSVVLRDEETGDTIVLYFFKFEFSGSKLNFKWKAGREMNHSWSDCRMRSKVLFRGLSISSLLYPRFESLSFFVRFFRTNSLLFD